MRPIKQLQFVIKNSWAWTSTPGRGWISTSGSEYPRPVLYNRLNQPIYLAKYVETNNISIPPQGLILYQQVSNVQKQNAVTATATGPYHHCWNLKVNLLRLSSSPGRVVLKVTLDIRLIQLTVWSYQWLTSCAPIMY